MVDDQVDWLIELGFVIDVVFLLQGDGISSLENAAFSVLVTLLFL